MKKLTILLILLKFGICYSQSTDSTSIKLKIDTTILFNHSFLNDTIWSTSFKLPECPFTIENAVKDIENDSMKIVIHRGFTGPGDIDSVRNEKFQEKYNVEFVYLGCIRYWDMKNEDTYGYNEQIFNHLTIIFGKDIRKEFKAIWN